MRQEGASAQTVLLHHRMIHLALRLAVQWQLLARNLAEAVAPPKPRREEMRALTAAEVERVLDGCAGDSLGTLVYVAVTTGLRQGELLGWKWGDIDFATKRAQIKRALQYLGGSGLSFRPPKTLQSARSISLSTETARALKEHRRTQVEQRLRLGAAYEDDDLVFAAPLGAPLAPYEVSRRFKRAVAAAGVAPCRFHDLRHTAATLMFQQGTHAKIVSERFGHANVNVTLNTYSHVQPDMQREAAEMMDQLIRAPIRERTGDADRQLIGNSLDG